MFTDSMFVTLATSIDRAKRDGNTSWENINKYFYENTSDRRYKVYCGNCTDSMSGFWFVGNPYRNGHKCYVEWQNGNIYVRHVSDYDKYDKKPCFEIVPLDNGGYRFEWQSRVLI